MSKYIVLVVLALLLVVAVGCAKYEVYPQPTPRPTPTPQIVEVADAFITRGVGPTKINIITSSGKALSFRLYEDDVRIFYDVEGDMPMWASINREKHTIWNIGSTIDKLELHLRKNFHLASR